MLNFDSIRPKHDGPPPDPEQDPAAALISADEVHKQAMHHWLHGNPNGSPTHFPTIGNHWLWQPGEACAITGWPGHGKSLAELNKMVTKAVYDDWNFGLFVPENMPLPKATAILVQSYVGKSANPKHPYKMTQGEYEAAVKWVTSHFTFIDPRLAHTLKTLLPAVKAAKKFNIRGWLLDPFNDLESKLGDFSGMMSEQLREQLNLVMNFSKDEEIATLICVHPSGEARNAKTLELKVPDQYSMEGGRMWPNKLDSICVWHRPLADDDPTDSQVDFRVRKMRNEPESGFKTPKDGVRINYERGLFRYIDPLLGMSPLDPIAIARYRQNGDNTKPIVNAEPPVLPFGPTPTGYGIRTHQDWASQFPDENPPENDVSPDPDTLPF